MHQLLQLTLISSCVPPRNKNPLLCAQGDPQLQGPHGHQAPEKPGQRHVHCQPPRCHAGGISQKETTHSDNSATDAGTLKQPLLMTLHLEKGSRRGGCALSPPMQSLVRQPASLQQGTRQVVTRVKQLSQQDRLARSTAKASKSPLPEGRFVHGRLLMVTAEGLCPSSRLDVL